MAGGGKAVILLLALVLIAGGAASSSTTDKHPEHVPYQHSHDSHPNHHRAPPLAEMFPPIGPVGFVAIGVVSDLNGFIFFGKKKEPVVNSKPAEPDGWANRPQDTTK